MPRGPPAGLTKQPCQEAAIERVKSDIEKAAASPRRKHKVGGQIPKARSNDRSQPGAPTLRSGRPSPKKGGRTDELLARFEPILSAESGNRLLELFTDIVETIRL
jgi:hypothetical protein